MGKIQNNQSGFSIVETVLVLIILILIGAVGWLVYQSHKKAPVAATASKKTVVKPSFKKVAPNPYAGWQSYCSSVGHICFKYPSNWTLQKNFYSASEGPSPEKDVVTSPSGSVTATYNVEQIGGVPDYQQINVLDARPVGTAFQQIALVQNNSDGSYYASVALVNKSLTEGKTNKLFVAGDTYTDQGNSNVYKFSNPALPSGTSYSSAFTVDGNFSSSPTSGNSEDTFTSLSAANSWYNSAEVKTATKILDSVTPSP